MPNGNKSFKGKKKSIQEMYSDLRKILDKDFEEFVVGKKLIVIDEDAHLYAFVDDENLK